MTSVSYALKELNQARNERDALLHIFDCIERNDGVGCEKLEALTRDKINPSHDRVTEAEKALILAKAKSFPEMLSKLAALMHECLAQEDMDVLREEAQAFLAPKKDPIVPLCRRWLTMHEAREQMLDECPTGYFDGPELKATTQHLRRLEAEILRLTPISPEGVALLAEMQLTNEGPPSLPGSEDWMTDMSNPQYLVMRRLAHGARLVAGIGA